MNFNPVWFIVAMVLRLARRGASSLALALPMLACAGAASAATNDFSGGAVANCTYASASQTYTCSSLSLAVYNDSTVIASGYTVIVNSNVAFGYNQSLQMSGSARLQTSGSYTLDISGSNYLNVTGGTFAAGGSFVMGSNAQAITANVTAASVTTGGSSTKITGTVTASGAISLGSNTTITGAVGAASITTNSNVTLGGTLTVSGAINLGSSTSIAGNVSGASLTTNSSVTLSGSVTATGKVDLGSSTTVAGGISAGSVVTNSSVRISGGISASGTVDLSSSVTVTGDVSGTVITTNSSTTITGNVSATTSFTLGSSASVVGNVSAPTVTLNAASASVKGNIAASTSLSLGSGATVNGNITGAALTMAASGVTINGNATMTGDVDIGSGDTINGDLSARNVTTHSSGDYISGNATVNAIYLDWGATVGKTITCTGAGASGCSCVTKADASYMPTCAAAPSAVDHILITHSGSALTCQAQSVTLTACANASCSSKASASTTVTLNPNGGNVTITGGTASASVRQSTAGVATLSATAVTSGAVTNGSSCYNSANASNSCAMSFADSGLVLSAPDHVSATPGVQLTVQALTSNGSGGSCVPLVQNATVPVNFSCSYKNPVAGTAAATAVSLGGTGVSCGGASTAVSLSFNNAGTATPALKYPEVGEVNLGAAYSGSGANANLAASGSTSFTAGPASIKVEPVLIVVPQPATDTVFSKAKASAPFTLKLSALNYDKNVTTNFGKESTPESFAVSEVLKTPSGGVNAITQGAFNAISGGLATSKSDSSGRWIFNDTGTITITVKLANASTYYLGKTAVTGLNPRTDTDLLFIPDHFDTALVVPTVVPSTSASVAAVPMSCTLLGGTFNPCSVANPSGVTNTSGSFLYSRQPFALAVYAYIGATDALGAYLSPQNYVGSAARVITLSAWNGAGLSTATATSVGDLAWSGGNDPATIRFTFAYDAASKKTIGTLNATPTGNLPSFNFATYGTPPAMPTPTAPTTLVLRATDGDGATSVRDTAANSVEAPLTVVSGRMDIANTSGSQNSNMPVKASAQYWSGSTWLFNSQFKLAALPIGQNVTFANCLNALDTSGNASHTCPTTLALASPATLAFANGQATFQIAAPKRSGTGSVDVTLQQAGATTYFIPYLPSGTGRATFGVYRSGPVIYMREIHN